jgi:DNA-binding transcriptional LysR family regulator
MTFKELELFYHLAEHAHISQLSKKINMSQSAISLAIKALEKSLGEPLFDRIGKKLILNERGRLFKEKTYKHFLALKDTQKLFQEDKLSGIIKIASSKTTGNFILPRLVFDFMLQNPHITIQREIKNSAQIIQMVLEGEIDMGIIETECQEPSIIKEELGSDRLIVVGNDETLSKKEYYIDQLAHKKWLLREPGSGTRELFLKALGNLAGELEIFMEFTEFEEMKTVLENEKETLTCISKFVVAKELERKELFEIKLKNIDLTRKLYIIYHKDKYKSTLFDSFEKYIKRHVQAIPKL